MFPCGADAYIDDIIELIPLTSVNIQTVIDTGCGVSSILASYIYMHVANQGSYSMCVLAIDAEAFTFFTGDVGFRLLIGVLTVFAFRSELFTASVRVTKQ